MPRTRTLTTEEGSFAFARLPLGVLFDVQDGLLDLQESTDSVEAVLGAWDVWGEACARATGVHEAQLEVAVGIPTLRALFDAVMDFSGMTSKGEPGEQRRAPPKRGESKRKIYGRVITGTGWTYPTVDALTFDQVEDLFAYWSKRPNASEVAAAWLLGDQVDDEPRAYNDHVMSGEEVAAMVAGLNG
jgi:hypothetical protein